MYWPSQSGQKGGIYNMPTPTVVATPAIDLLLLLQQYNQLRRIADENIRSSIWNITKARRSASSSSLSSTDGNSAYSVNDVREELVATAVLEYTTPVVSGKDEDDDEERLPNLVADPSDGIDTTMTMTKSLCAVNVVNLYCISIGWRHC